tara:strand:- start:6437 stop:6934 length:498 start_codon:yes stop_codon:yes gene_type:complete
MDVNTLPWQPTLDIGWLERFFRKNYYKKPYDRFMWWRSYTPKFKPLSNKSPFRDRIANGDFDIAPYRFEAMLVEHRMNQKWIDCKGYEDTYREATQVDKARRTRLLEDYDKEETKRLQELRKGFILNLKITGEQYDKEVLRPSKNLLSFYDKMEKKYGTRGILPK